MRYAAPATLEEALKLLLAERGAFVLAGGTDLMVRMKSASLDPELVVDIKRIPGMSEIDSEEGGWRIGAAVSGAMIGEHPGLCAAWPGVVEAVKLIGSTQIQGRATLVGNLCNASPAADCVPALVVAGATARIHGPDRTRDIPVAAIPVGPGRTSLATGEIIVSLSLPAPAPRAADAYFRFTPRSEMDIAVAAAAAWMQADESGRCAEARVALGAVAPTSLVVAEAADLLRGTAIDAATLERLASLCSAACRPIDDKRGSAAFRRQVVGVMAKRAAAKAWARALDRPAG